MQLIAKDIADWKAKAQIIAVFHTNAGHVTLHDEAYNVERMVATGNPYKQLLVELMRRGVEVELCGATATVHKWGNGDLLPGIKVNTDAMARMSQLVQEGSVQILAVDRNTVSLSHDQENETTSMSIQPTQEPHNEDPHGSHLPRQTGRHGP